MLNKTIHVHYYAFFREKAQISAETLETTAKSAADLYTELAQKYDFTLPEDRVKVAVNEEFRAMDVCLQAGDNVVFIPPVAGG